MHEHNECDDGPVNTSGCARTVSDTQSEQAKRNQAIKLAFQTWLATHNAERWERLTSDERETLLEDHWLSFREMIDLQ